MTASYVTIEGTTFPLRSAKPGRCAQPMDVVAGVAYCPRSANNVLLLDPPRDLHKVFPGWKPVGARPRWNLLDGAWRANDASMQRAGQHRWWGRRDHVRMWLAQDGSYAIGQAHTEDWQRWPRRHRVLALDPARDALARSFAASEQADRESTDPARGTRAPLSWFDTGVASAGHDGRVLVLRC